MHPYWPARTATVAVQSEPTGPRSNIRFVTPDRTPTPRITHRQLSSEPHGSTPPPPLPVYADAVTMEDMPHVSGTTKELHVPDEVAPGQVILLNGVSSSGKSSIARQLLIDLERPFFHMGVDMIGAMRSRTRTHELDATALTDVLRRTRAGFHRAVAAMALAGNDIVMDHVLERTMAPTRLPDRLRRHRRRFRRRPLLPRRTTPPRTRARRSPRRHRGRTDPIGPRSRNLRPGGRHQHQHLGALLEPDQTAPRPSPVASRVRSASSHTGHASKPPARPERPVASDGTRKSRRSRRAHG